MTKKLALILGYVFIDVLGFSLILPLLPFYAESFEASPTSVGLLLAANAINIVVAVSAFLMARAATRAGKAAGAPPSDESLPSELPVWLTGIVLFASGFTTLGYEIVWFRALRYLIGNGTYVLTNVLVIFLLGLGFGGFFYRAALRLGRAESNLALCQLGI